MSDRLPENPSDDELSRDWTLSPADLVEVRRCRGAANRHRFALQLCVLRNFGRFTRSYEAIPVRVLNHLGAQLKLPPLLLLSASERGATETNQAHRIRRYLGYGPFDEDAQDRLRAWMEERVAEGVMNSGDLMAMTRSTLRSWNVEAPAQSTLKRLIGSATTKIENDAWERIASGLPPALCETIDELLEVTEGHHRSALFHLKRYPPEATPKAILQYLDRIDFVHGLALNAIDFGGTTPEVMAYLADLVRRYSARDLRRFAPAKRHAMLACFLVETQKTLLDHVVEMHRTYLTSMERRARRAVDKKRKEIRRQTRKSLAQVLDAFERFLDPPDSIDELHEDIDLGELREALSHCRKFQRLGELGQLKALQARHSHLKQYLPRFLKLPLEAETAGTDLLAAIEYARKLHSGDRQIDASAPTDFIPRKWHSVLLASGEETPDLRLWEIGLAMAVRDAIRAGDLFLADSRHHVSFWNLVLGKEQWEAERARAFAALRLPTEADRALDHLQDDLNEVAIALRDGLGSNTFASVVDGGLRLSRREALPVPKEARRVRQLIETRLPRVQIGELLAEVDSWCGFTRELVPLGGYTSRIKEPYPAILAALVAQGTNLGVATMAKCAQGVTLEELRRVARWFEDRQTLKAANRVLIDHHQQLELASLWGAGRVSSSDGQRFGIQASSLLASFYPRYFGYYDRAVNVYTHVSDQHTVFGSRVISCSAREASYVLDGLLENDTILRPREHTTDTHGFTEQLFALCHLLGFSFMPRLKDLKTQHLYKLDRDVSYGEIDGLFRGGPIDIALIREQWDKLVHVATSVRDRTAPAHVILQRLGASPSDRLSKAFTHLGRLVKTLHLLRYMGDAALRDRVQLQLNRGEFRHALAAALFYANHGVFRSGDYAEIMNKVSALSVLSNAVVVWNTVKIAELLASLAEPVSPETLVHISPMIHAHVIPNGTYQFARQRAA